MLERGGVESHVQLEIKLLLITLACFAWSASIRWRKAIFKAALHLLRGAVRSTPPPSAWLVARRTLADSEQRPAADPLAAA